MLTPARLEPMDAKVLISNLADSARIAGRTLSVATGAQRMAALLAIADAIEALSLIHI